MHTQTWGLRIPPNVASENFGFDIFGMKKPSLRLSSKQIMFLAGMSEIAISDKINGTEQDGMGRNKTEWGKMKLNGNSTGFENTIH